MPAYPPNAIQTHLNAVDNAPTADAKGDALEELIRYLFSQIPGVAFSEKNALDGARAHELDVLFWNPSNASELSFLDSILITECKATNDRVGSAAVAWFATKLDGAGAESGVLIALSGVTGDQDALTSAARQIYDTLIGLKIKILVLTRTELLALTSTDDLVELLKRKFYELKIRRRVDFVA